MCCGEAGMRREGDVCGCGGWGRHRGEEDEREEDERAMALVRGGAGCVRIMFFFICERRAPKKALYELFLSTLIELEVLTNFS